MNKLKNVWVITLMVLTVLSISATPVQSKTFLPGGDADDPVKITAANASRVVELNSVIEYTNKLDFSPDGSTLASAAFERRVRLWHVPRPGVDEDIRENQWNIIFRLHMLPMVKRLPRDQEIAISEFGMQTICHS